MQLYIVHLLLQLINALVMHVGTSAIQFIRSKGATPNMSTICHSSHMDIFQVGGELSLPMIMM